MDNLIKKGLLSGEIKPEFGNTDHIDFLEKHNRYATLFKLGAPVSMGDFNKKVILRIDFECPGCLQNVETEVTTREVDYDYNQLQFTVEQDFSHSFVCDNCKQKFRLHNGILNTAGKENNG